MLDSSTDLNCLRRLAERGRMAEALERLEWDLCLAPGAAELLLTRARLREWCDDVEGALADCETLLAARPDWAEAWLTKGSLHARRQERMTALECFRRARKRRPGWAAAEHLIASLGGRGFEAPLRSEVTELFDRYAERFDEHLVGQLDYRGHRILAEAVHLVSGEAAGDWRVLDLGSGTGLCGQELRPLAGWLSGVDLSAPSVALARQRGVYDLVWVADLVYALATTPDRDLDLIVAADVLGYLGSLDTVLGEARRVTRAGGYLAFTVEAGDGSGDYRLGPARRFAYRASYLERALAGAGFTPVHTATRALRREGQGEVVAHVVVAKRRRSG